MDKARLTLSMVTFFYNEENVMADYLKTVTEKFKIVSSKSKFGYEIIMIDDGSTDKSREIVKKFIEKNKEIKLILHSCQTNKGIGYAFIEGVKRASNDYIFSNDIDMHFDILDLEKVIPLLEQKTIVVVYKRNITYKRFFPWMVSRANYYILKLLFYPEIKDFQFVQFYPKKFIKGVEIISRSSLIACELLTRSKDMGYKLSQTPLYYTSPQDNRKSKCLNLKTIFNTLRDIKKLKMGLKK